jgi:hypothetical protein
LDGRRLGDRVTAALRGHREAVCKHRCRTCPGFPSGVGDSALEVRVLIVPATRRLSRRSPRAPRTGGLQGGLSGHPRGHDTTPGRQCRTRTRATPLELRKRADCRHF